MLSLNDIYSNSEYSGSGPTLHAGMKLFFSGESFYDGYFEMFYRYDRCSYTLLPKGKSFDVEYGNLADIYTHHFAFGFGYEWNSGRNDQMTHEVFCHVGMKLIKFTRFDLDPASPRQTPLYRRSSGLLSAKLWPALNFGYAFGFGF
jgi:hypothetical protein